MSDLKPCPFCGEEDFHQETNQGYKWGAIVCSTCAAWGPEVRTGYGEHQDWKEEAVTAWNTRAQDAEVKRLREEACEVISSLMDIVTKYKPEGPLPMHEHFSMSNAGMFLTDNCEALKEGE